MGIPLPNPPEEMEFGGIKVQRQFTRPGRGERAPKRRAEMGNAVGGS